MSMSACLQVGTCADAKPEGAVQTRMGRIEMCTPSERNAEEEKCLIKEKFQRELSGQGKEKTKGKQDKINKGPLHVSAQAFLHKAPPQAAGAAAAPSLVPLLGGEDILPEDGAPPETEA